MRLSIVIAAGLLLPASGASLLGQGSLALTLGPNIVTLTDHETPHSFNGQTPWALWGGAVGVVAGFPISEKWGVQAGGGLSTKGQYEANDDTDGCVAVGPYGCSEGWSRTLPFLEVTVLADRRLTFADHGVHLLAGAFLGYAFGNHPLVDLMEERLDFGVAGGVRINAGLGGRWGISLGALYTHGLRDIGGYDMDFAATRALNLSIGPSFSIG
ncbi:MAG: outer membrane beta-barrel protein [Gemmatimonadetes bacterium]|nr:outer membrane beta-barrel protein [Gemmatimonadota bacterium]MCY3942177.1 outer membrane beta-barrel protein [Gemmatimonadota bacterium]